HGTVIPFELLVDVPDELVEVDLRLPRDGGEGRDVDGGGLRLAQRLARVVLRGVVEDERAHARHAQGRQLQFDPHVRVRLHVRAGGDGLGERLLEAGPQGAVRQERVRVDVAAQATGEVREAALDLPRSEGR